MSTSRIMKSNTSALNGITVLDLSMLLPGPFCTMMLAHFGARVIKIEQPLNGDLMREYTPRYNSYSSNFAFLNSNKESVTLNLKTTEGKEIFLKLVEKSDVLVEGFRPGVMKKLGLDYSYLSQINKRLVYCSITGYGQKDEDKMVAGHDINYIASNGILYLNGYRDKPPIPPSSLIADIGGGGYPALVGILVALLAREKTGEGQFVDISMTDCSLVWIYYVLGEYFINHRIPERQSEMINGGFHRYRTYQTKDGKYVAVGALEDKFWHNLCDLLDIKDERIRNHDKEFTSLATKALEEKFISKESKEWENLFKSGDYCCNLVKNFEEVAKTYLKKKKIFTELEKGGEKYIVFSNPIHLSKTPAQILQAAPLLGENNKKVIIEELGYSIEDYELLKEKQII